MASPPTNDAQEVADGAEKVVDSVKSYFLRKILPYALGAVVVVSLIASATDKKNRDDDDYS